ncbi:MAG: outer membrane beta-barrel protein [Polyangiaceae bacterium]
MKAIAAAILAVAFTVIATPARAVEEEKHLGVDLGAAMLVLKDQSAPDLGPAMGGHFTYGLTDAFNLMAEGTFSIVSFSTPSDPRAPKTLPAWTANADVGVGYVFDVLRWVPYAGLLVGGYALSGGTLGGVKILPGAEIALGLDYRVDRSLSVGVALRQHWLTEQTTYPSFSQALARVEYSWGW